MTIEAPPGTRVAIGSISQESNHFAGTTTGLDLFRNTYLHVGPDVLQLRGTDCEVAGAIAECERAGVEVVPLLATRSVSGGRLTDDCYQYLRSGLLSRLRAALPVAGVLLALHGAMVAESEDDAEGDILTAVRALVGPDVPVVATLDLHAHITQRMVDAATGLVSYAHYPHDDTFDTGERGARLLLARLSGRDVTMVVAKAPMVVTGCNEQTAGSGPLAQLTRRARELERLPGVLSVSCVPVQPYLDVADMGCAACVITAGLPGLATKLATSLAEEFWSRRAEFLPEVLAVDEAVARGRRQPAGPVLLVDTADCAGGGASGDSAALLRELLRIGVTEPTYLMVVDPAAALACSRAGMDGEVTVDLGHHQDPQWGQPVRVTGRVGLLTPGRFLYTGGAFGGTWGAMGLSAVLHVGSIRALVMSKPTYDWADEQYRSVGLDPRQARFIGVKNPMNYRFAYRDVAVAAYIVDTPGPTPAHVRHLPFRKLTRPAFPLDAEVPEPRIRLLRSRRA